MRDLEKLDGKTSDFDRLFWGNRIKPGLVEQAMLLKLVLYQSHRKPRAIDGNIEIRQNEWQRTDMVLVTMGEENGFDFVSVLEKVTYIRNDDVDSEQFFVGEHHASINDDDCSVAPKRHHVHAEFTET